MRRVAAGAVGLVFAAAVVASPLRIIVPSDANSADYRVASVLAEALSREVGDRVIVDAQGAEGTAAFKASVRDGRTLLFARDAVLTLNPLSKRQPLLEDADVATVRIIGEVVSTLACSPASAIQNLNDWRTRARQGKLELGVLDDPAQTAFAHDLGRGRRTRNPGICVQERCGAARGLAERHGELRDSSGPIDCRKA